MGARAKDGPRLSRGEIAGRRVVVVSFPVAPRLDAVAMLSHAQRDVARLVLAGKSNRQIATERSTSERTVANQLATIYRKLGVGSRSELAALLHAEER